jgi:phosphomannomutase/phosphoglucomutase
MRAKRTDADLGLAFDGDGDRLGVVTKDGEIIYPDRQLMLFAADVLERNPGRASSTTSSARAPATGSAPRRQPADVEDRPLADQGEDEGDRRAARRRDERPLLLQASAGTASTTASTRPRACWRSSRRADPSAVLERAARRRVDARAQGPVRRRRAAPRSSTLPSSRRRSSRARACRPSTACASDWPDGWGLVRASNTTPVLVLRFDAKDSAALARIQSCSASSCSRSIPDAEAAVLVGIGRQHHLFLVRALRFLGRGSAAAAARPACCARSSAVSARVDLATTLPLLALNSLRAWLTASGGSASS